jgi:hypothetical protein
MEDDLYFVVDNDTSEEKTSEIESSAEKCSQEEPCAKFGIVANIDVLTVDQMKSKYNSGTWWDDETLYLYSDDEHNKYDRVVSFKDWIIEVSSPSEWRNKTAKNHYPAIISNIGINVEQPKEDSKTNDNESESKIESTQISDF